MDKKHELALKLARSIQIERAGTLETMAKPWMLIDGLIPQGSICVVAGPSYSGKTFLAMEAARAIASGQPFLGHFSVPETSRGNVLFIEQDSPKYDTGNAIWAMIKKQWKEERPEGGLQHPLEGIHFAWHPGLNLLIDLDAYAITKTANSLFTHLINHVYDDLIYDEAGDVVGFTPGEPEAVGYRGTKLIILDTLRALNTGDENESGAMEAVMQRLKLIRALTGATIILIHHTSATGERLRGSTAIDGAADCIFYVKGQRGRVSVTVQKARAIQPENFKFEITSQERAELGLTKRVEYRGAIEDQEESEGELEVYLRKYEEVSREQLLEWTALNGGSVATMDRRLKKLPINKRTEGKRVFYRLG